MSMTVHPFDVVVAASDTPEALKRHASHVCPEGDARPTLQRAIDEAGVLDVKCVLLPGTYRVDSRGERSPRGAICFWNPDLSEADSIMLPPAQWMTWI